MLWDRRRGLTYDDAGVRAKWGVPPTSIPDYLALVGDASDGYPGLPGWGSKSAAAVLSRYGHFEDIPPKASAWEVPGVGGTRAIALAATLRERWDEALLYRDLARLRTVEDGVPIRQRDADELRWDGAPRLDWEAFCDEWGLDRLRRRPHRWLADAMTDRRPTGARCHHFDRSVRADRRVPGLLDGSAGRTRYVTLGPRWTSSEASVGPASPRPRGPSRRPRSRPS